MDVVQFMGKATDRGRVHTDKLARHTVLLLVKLVNLIGHSRAE